MDKIITLPCEGEKHMDKIIISPAGARNIRMSSSRIRKKILLSENLIYKAAGNINLCAFGFKNDRKINTADDYVNMPSESYNFAVVKPLLPVQCRILSYWLLRK